MEKHGESDRGFGLMRALSRVRSTSRTSRMIEGVHIKDKAPSEMADTERDPVSPAEFADEQQSLKDRQGALELWPLPGLAPMTRVRTSFGDVHAIALRKGDKVLTKSGDYHAIEWVNRIMLDEHILNLKPDSNPVMVGTGAFGAGVPSQDIMVSPRQIFCADERSGLPKAREASMLLSRKGIRRVSETGLTYTMFHVGKTADVFCEGLFLRFPIET